MPSLALWAIGAVLILTGIALFIAPLPRWRIFLATEWSALLPAIGVAIAAPWLSARLQPIWSIDRIADQIEKVIGAGDFYIKVANVCSGIEGIALVTLFVSLYLWLFRKDLWFPLALLLYPVGIAASIGFNILRITILLFIGLEGNPDLAVGGFHSHAGWMMFTLVALGAIALAQTVPALRRTGTAPHHVAHNTRLPF